MRDDFGRQVDDHVPTRVLDPAEVDDLVGRVRAGVVALQRRRRRQRGAVVVLAAAVLLVVGWLGLGGRTAPEPEVDGPLPSELAVVPADERSAPVPAPVVVDENPRIDDRVVASEGSRLDIEGPPEDRVVHLEAGRVACTVVDRAPGERFRVVVGGDEVEVTGTQFTVVATASVLSAVLVTEGEVIVRLEDGRVQRLRAGEEWTRSDVPQPAADPVVSTPAPEAAVPPAVVAPPGPEVVFSEALARYDAADFDGALRRFRSVDSGPLAADARFWAAVTRVQMGRDDEAVDMLQEALDEGVPVEREGAVHCVLGQLLASRGSPLAARRHFEMAARDADPDVAECGRRATER